MNYDVSISTEVSLSKVLDEMILDGTDLEIVLTFLKSHEGQIADIYKHSAFVYDLYDLAAHPYRVNDFLTKHIEDLPTTDMCFAGESLTHLLVIENIYPEVLCKLRKLLQGNANFIRFRSSGFKGRLLEDAKVAAGDMDFFKLIELAASDKRDIRILLQESYLSRSMLMATNFIYFSPRTQFVILSTIVDIFRSSEHVWRGHVLYIGHSVNTLLKQLLVAGETDTFNWVVNVLQLHSPNDEIVNELWSDQFERIPSVLGERFARDLHTFEEVVFEMNMMETQFDVLDLFIYIYLFDRKLFRGMRENVELLEFFNLPFQWDELERLKPEWRP